MNEKDESRFGLSARVRKGWGSALGWIRHHIPPGLRLLIGLLLMIGGIFGILPVLGFWMFPLGVAVVALDIRALVRFLRRNHD